MKKKEFDNLKEGDRVLHKLYGECTVEGYIPEFGPIIMPDTESGKILLIQHSGVKHPLLETSMRLIQAIT